MGVIYREGSTIGTAVATTAAAASGMWTLYDVDSKTRTATWPVQLVTSGLVLLFDPAIEASYSGSGTTLSDISGNANNGTLVNSPTYSSLNGGKFTLNGATNYISTAYNASLGESLSFGGWCRPTAAGGSNGSELISKGYATTAPFASWGIDFTSAREFRFFVSDSTTFGNVSSAAQTLNNWYYVFATYNNKLLNCYINGVLVATRTSTNTILYTTTYAVLIGNSILSASNHWTGDIAQIQLYNRNLSLSEITQNFNALRNRYGV